MILEILENNVIFQLRTMSFLDNIVNRSEERRVGKEVLMPV